jgi:hypothetical protein
MESLKEESQEDYMKQFSQWDKCLKANKVSSVEALFTKVHAAILKDPSFTKKKPAAAPKRDHSKYRTNRTGRVARKNRANEKIKIALSN